ncbi:MAG: hypothetical protein JSV05_02050 [Candidatus Bathyarchaeota archaeon]|nr:MAG: hypothetical protein JSV05_02050 [Candidatus Bathyarchaeota archaeon]
MSQKCLYCGLEIKEENAIYCSSCGSPFKPTFSKETGFPIAGGILSIAISGITIVFGIVGLLIAIQLPQIQSVYHIMGIFGIIAFLLGLGGGIASLKRRRFVLSLLGTCFMLLSGFVNIIVIGWMDYRGHTQGFFLNLPIIVLSIISMIFIAISYKEFA